MWKRFIIPKLQFWLHFDKNIIITHFQDITKSEYSYCIYGILVCWNDLWSCLQFNEYDKCLVPRLMSKIVTNYSSRDKRWDPILDKSPPWPPFVWLTCALLVGVPFSSLLGAKCMCMFVYICLVSITFKRMTAWYIDR